MIVLYYENQKWIDREIDIPQDIPWAALLVLLGLSTSKSEAKRLIKQGGVTWHQRYQ